MSPSILKALAWKPLDGIVPPNVTLVSSLQKLKASEEILVTLAGIG